MMKWLLALIVFARFWRILRVINGVIVGTKQDADTRVSHLKKKIALLQSNEYDNRNLQENLQEAIEENARLNLLSRAFKLNYKLVWISYSMKALVSDRLNQDDGQLNAELTRIETENKRLKDEFLRLTIQYSG